MLLKAAKFSPFGAPTCYAAAMRQSAFIVLLMLFWAAVPVGLAQEADALPDGIDAMAAPARQAIRLTVYGEDPCPKGQGDEIIVCARQPESERYRIPKKIRDRPVVSDAGGWTNQAAAAEEIQRELTLSGCTASNSSIFGCLQKALRIWRAEREMAKRENTP